MYCTCCPRREILILVIWKEFGKDKWVISVPFKCDYLLKMLFTPHMRLLTGKQDDGRSESIMWKSPKSIPNYFNINIDNNYSFKGRHQGQG